MIKSNTTKIYIGLVAIAAIFFIGKIIFYDNNIIDLNHSASDNKPPEVTTYTKSIKIVPDSTYAGLMAQEGVDASLSLALFNAAMDVYDLSQIRVDRTIDLIYDKQTDQLEELVYQVSTEEKLYITRQIDSNPTTTVTTTPTWIAERRAIPYEVKIKTEQGEIETSMYQAALDKDIDVRAIIDLADVFQWSVDFALDVRKGDTFKFIFEERYLDGEYIMPGRTLAGKYINDGKVYYAFYFEESDDNKGHFDENGNSVQKIFLKAPVAYKYVTSGFTTGKRYIEAFNISTGHRAIDYAAAYGTPVRSVGDGMVVRAGWNGSYGNSISIRHNDTYTTNYAHLSRYAVRYGQKVKQGQTIGYVGSTGLSTGPHLHYEMLKHGSKINALREELPPGEAIKEENKEQFFISIVDLKKQLDN